MKTKTPSQLFQATALLFATAWLSLSLSAQDAKPPAEKPASPAWTKTDTQLANHYIQILQKEPAYGDVLNLLWKLYEKKDQTPLLLEYFAAAADNVTAQDINSVPLLIYGHLLRKSDQLDEARELYSQVIEITPDSIPALQALAEMADRQQRFGKALSLYNRLENLVPITSEEGITMRLKQATLHQKQSQLESAISIWNTLLENHPTRVQLRTEIVSLLLEAGETDSAIQVLTRIASSDDPQQKLNALTELNRIYEFISNFKAAADAATQGLGVLHYKSHDYSLLFGRLVQIHERFDHLADLETQLVSKVSKANPTEKSLHDLAAFYRLTANPEAEESTLLSLAERLPNNIPYRIRLAKIQMRNDHFDQAAETLDSVIAGAEIPPLNLVLLRAEIALNTENKIEAEEILKHYLEISTPDASKLRVITDFARSNYLDDLVETLLRRGSPDEGNEVLPTELAGFLTERGRRNEAVDILWKFANAAGDRQLEKINRLQQIALVLRDVGTGDEALEAINQAAELAPDRIDLLENKADILVDAGRIEEALDLLSQIWDHSDELDKKLEIDQRLFSLLRGHFTKDEIPEDFNVLRNGGIQTLAQYRKLAILASKANRPGDEPPPQELLDYYQEIISTANTSPTLTNRYRAAWWAFKLQDGHECYDQLTKANEEAGKPVLEVELLLLSLAELNERTTHMVDHLTILAEIDPENANDYLQRRAEMRFELGYEDEAVRTLNKLASEPDVDLSTLNTLARVYSQQGNSRKQIEVWTQAYRQANAIEKRTIIKQLSTVLVENSRPEEALAAQLELLEEESDSVQRRRQLDAQINLARSHFLLDWLLDQYQAMSQQHALDPFFPEALSRIYLAAGNTSSAFEAMKKAYYMSDRSDGLLDELGLLADELNDLKSAIYYRRQLLMREEGNDLENWQTLIEMLEKDLRVAEADLLRRRLESRFGRDPEFLSELAEHYRKNGQLGSAQRALEKIVSLRDWDLKAKLHLGLILRQRGQKQNALIQFNSVVAASTNAKFPKSVERALPLIRVNALSHDAKARSGSELESIIFAVEEFPYLGGELQDDIAEALQKPHREFEYLPEKTPWIRLRAIEEAAQLSAETGQTEQWIEQWKDSDRPRFESLWAARHSAENSETARRHFVKLLDETPIRKDHIHQFQLTCCRLLAGDTAGLETWLTSPSSPGTQSERAGYLAMAALVILTDPIIAPECPVETILDCLARNSAHQNNNAYLVTKLRDTGHYETAYQLGLILAESELSQDGEFLALLSRIAGQAGHKKERSELLDQALDAMSLRHGQKPNRDFFATLTERLSLMNSDSDRVILLDDLYQSIGPAELIGKTNRQERTLLLSIASGQSKKAISQLKVLTQRQVDFIRPRDPEPDEIRYDQSQSWQRMGQLLRYYVERIPITPDTDDAFVSAISGGALALPVDDSVIAEYEQFEIDRQCLKLEWKNAPERNAIVQQIQSQLFDPVSRMELGKALESRGFYREAIPVFHAEARLQNRDYAPVQRLFDASAEALDPEPALDLISRINSREYSAPPGLTSEYLAEQHSRFLMIDRNIERLISLSRQPSGSRGSPPITTTSHLPYQDALIEAYRQSGNDDALLRLLTQLKSSESTENSHLLLGANILTRQGQNAEAIEWLSSIPFNQSDPEIERQAMTTAAKLHRSNLEGGAEAIAVLAATSLRQQPPGITRHLARTAHHAGASRESVSILKLLRRSTSNPKQRFATTFLLLQVQREAGAEWDELRDEWEALFHDFIYDPSFQPSAEADSDPTAFGSNAFHLVDWLINEAGGLEPLPAILESTPAPQDGEWIRTLLLSFFKETFETGVQNLYSDSPARRQEQILETLPAFGELGIQLTRSLINETQLPGDQYFTGSPLQQINFFHRIGDHPRLIEVHSTLMQEAQSDQFHQSGLEAHHPTLTNRYKIPKLLQSIGEPDLAKRLFVRYHNRIGLYRWNHQPFLEDYAHFLIETEDFEEAERLLHRVFQKSLRVDLRLLIQLYHDWGKIDDWDSLTSDFYLSSGQIALLNDWRTALAEGREMVDYRNSW